MTALDWFIGATILTLCGLAVALVLGRAAKDSDARIARMFNKERDNDPADLD